MPLTEWARALQALAALTEDDFTRVVAMPLLQEMFAGARVEHTHGPLEAGRDIVIQTRHEKLDRIRIICVQLKSHRLSAGASTGNHSLASVLNQVSTARHTGVIAEDGTRLRPHEIWVMTSHAFPESERRAGRDMIQKIEDSNGTILDGEAVLKLVRKHCSAQFNELAKISDPAIAALVAALADSPERRAIAALTRRGGEEIHIPTRVRIGSAYSMALLNSGLAFQISEDSHGVDIDGKTAAKLPTSGRGIPEDGLRTDLMQALSPYATVLRDSISWTTTISRTALVAITRRYEVVDQEALRPNLTAPPALKCGDSFEATSEHLLSRVSPNSGTGLVEEDIDSCREAADLFRLVQAGALSNDSLQRALRWTTEAKELGSDKDVCRATRKCKVDLSQYAARMRLQLDRQRKALPETLGDELGVLRDIVAGIAEFDAVLSAYKRGGGVSRRSNSQAPSESLSVCIPDVSRLLDLSDRLLIEGVAGSGKTTLLRRVAASKIIAGEQVFFVSCARIAADSFGDDLETLVRKHCLPDTPPHWTLETSSLLIDALDEGPFDIAGTILEYPKTPRQIVVTTRKAHHSSLKGRFLCLELERFTNLERDTFFEKWFRDDASALQRTTDLVQRYDDIAQHARTPLVATLLGILVERDYAPTTRNAIYRDRLDFLLERWDYARGVETRRMAIEPRKRFLEHLAFWAHSVKGRTSFSYDEAHMVYADALGKAAQEFSFETLMDNLVTGCGVIVLEDDRYSFGHHTFQEHLVAAYLTSERNPIHVARYLGKSWWRGVLNFYAAEKRDITTLIEHCEHEGITSTHADQLREMGLYARYTKTIAAQVVERAARHIELATRVRAPRPKDDVDDPYDMEGRDEDASLALRSLHVAATAEGDVEWLGSLSGDEDDQLMEEVGAESDENNEGAGHDDDDQDDDDDQEDEVE